MRLSTTSSRRNTRSRPRQRRSSRGGRLHRRPWIETIPAAAICNEVRTARRGRPHGRCRSLGVCLSPHELARRPHVPRPLHSRPGLVPSAREAVHDAGDELAAIDETVASSGCRSVIGCRRCHQSSISAVRCGPRRIRVPLDRQLRLDPPAQLLHLRPVDLGIPVMLLMVAVVEPEQIV